MDTIADRDSTCTPTPSLVQDYVTLLPPELLLMILLLLPLRERLCVRLTCRRLHSLINDPSLWDHIAWKHVTQSDDNLLKAVLRISSPHLRELELTSTSGQLRNYPELSDFLSRCRNTRSLSLCGFLVSASQVEVLIQAMPQLSHVRIDLSFESGPRRDAEKVLSAAKSLESLIIGLPTDMHRHATQHVANLAWTLRVWSKLDFYPADLGLIHKELIVGCLDDDYLIGNIYFLKLREIQCSHRARLCLHIPSVPMKLTPLQPVFEVHLPYSPVLACGKPLGLSSYFMLSQGAMGSDHFSRAHCCQLHKTVNALDQVAQKSFMLFAQCISSLKLEGSNLASTHLEAIACACPNLTDLDIAHCTDALKSLQGLAAIARGCPKLKGLNVNYIHNDHVEDIQTFWDILSRIEHLAYLTVTGCLISPNSPAQSNARGSAVTTTIIKKMLRLQALQIASISEVKDSNYCPLPDSELPSLSNMVSLRCLRIFDLPPVRVSLGPGFGELLGKLNHLTYLNISFPYSKPEPQRLTLPTDASFYTSLEQLYVRCWNFAVSDALVDALVHSRKLTHVFLLIGSISQTGLLNLIQKSPRLTVCNVDMTAELESELSNFEEALHSIVESQRVDYFRFNPGAKYYYSVENYHFVDSLLQNTQLHPFHEFHADY